MTVSGFELPRLGEEVDDLIHVEEGFGEHFLDLEVLAIEFLGRFQEFGRYDVLVLEVGVVVG